jgi:hypothetical protein
MTNVPENSFPLGSSVTCSRMLTFACYRVVAQGEMGQLIGKVSRSSPRTHAEIPGVGSVAWPPEFISSAPSLCHRAYPKSTRAPSGIAGACVVLKVRDFSWDWSIGGAMRNCYPSTKY